MNLKTLTALVILSSILFYASLVTLQDLLVIEHEIASTVTNVIDGDTFDIAAGYRVKLADIDCPEQYEIGYEDASYYLWSLIHGETLLIDVDDVYQWDQSGDGDRVVCVAYLRFNESHVLNINEAMLESGYAVLDDFPNSFNPDEWSMYTPILRVINYENLRLYSGLSALVLTTLIYFIYCRLSSRLRKFWQNRFNKDKIIE